MLKVLCPVDGNVIINKKIPDETFSKNLMGITMGIVPKSRLFVAPISGKVVLISGHSYCIESVSGIQVFVHIGIDTVKISDEDKAKIFKYKINQDEKVKAGQLIVEADLDGIKKCGYSIITPVFIIKDTIENKNVTYETIGRSTTKDALFKIE